MLNGVAVRYLVRTDLSDVMRIEQLCYDEPWGKDDYLKALKQKPIYGKVIEVDDQIVGFILTERTKYQLFVQRIAVRPLMQRQRVGSFLLESAINSAGTNQNVILARTASDDFESMSFLAFNGFEAVRHERKKEEWVLRRLLHTRPYDEFGY